MPKAVQLRPVIPAVGITKNQITITGITIPVPRKILTAGVRMIIKVTVIIITVITIIQSTGIMVTHIMRMVIIAIAVIPEHITYGIFRHRGSIPNML